MRQLKIFEHISLDGVIQHSADGSGFAYENWTAPYRTPEVRDAILAAQGERFDLLLGRRTYDIWSGYWPQAPDSPSARSLNAATKYVLTHHPETLAWGPVGHLGLDLVGAVQRLKEQDGPDLIVWGSSTLTSTLLNYQLVDELTLIVYPVVLGAGKRLIAERARPRQLELRSQRAFSSGILLNAYRPIGPLEKAAQGE